MKKEIRFLTFQYKTHAEVNEGIQDWLDRQLEPPSIVGIRIKYHEGCQCVTIRYKSEIEIPAEKSPNP